jgi:hypothetical protein
MDGARKRSRAFGLTLIIGLMAMALFDVDWLGDGPQCSCDAANFTSALMALSGSGIVG